MKLVAYNDCGVDSVVKQINIIAVSIKEVSGINGIMIFPNPTNDNVNIQFNTEENTNVEIKLLNSLGQCLWTDSQILNDGSYHNKISLKGFAKGFYLINISTGKGSITKRLIYY